MFWERLECVRPVILLVDAAVMLDHHVRCSLLSMFHCSDSLSFRLHVHYTQTANSFEQSFPLYHYLCGICSVCCIHRHATILSAKLISIDSRVNLPLGELATVLAASPHDAHSSISDLTIARQVRFQNIIARQNDAEPVSSHPGASCSKGDHPSTARVRYGRVIAWPGSIQRCARCRGVQHVCFCTQI